MPGLQVLGVGGLPEIGPGDDIGAMVHAAASAQGDPLADGDVVVVTSKIVSKSEGCAVELAEVTAVRVRPVVVARALDAGCRPIPTTCRTSPARSTASVIAASASSRRPRSPSALDWLFSAVARAGANASGAAAVVA